MDSSYNTQDLRAVARDYKRDADYQHKWENGEARGPGRSSVAHARPAKTSQLAALRYHNKAGKESAINRTKINQKRDLVYDTAEATDSSADEEVEPSAAPEPDSEITYSYDAERGPSQGSQVLGYALSQAVERFENKATDKLVKDEYLVLDSDGEPVASKSDKRKATRSIEHDEEDEYEFL